MAFQDGENRWTPAKPQEGIDFKASVARGKGHAPFTWQDGTTYQCPVRTGTVRSSATGDGDKAQPKAFCPIPGCEKHKGAAAFGWMCKHFAEKHPVRRLARSVALARRPTSARASSRAQTPDGGAAPTAPGFGSAMKGKKKSGAIEMRIVASAALRSGGGLNGPLPQRLRTDGAKEASQCSSPSSAKSDSFIESAAIDRAYLPR